VLFRSHTDRKREEEKRERFVSSARKKEQNKGCFEMSSVIHKRALPHPEKPDQGMYALPKECLPFTREPYELEISYLGPHDDEEYTTKRAQKKEEQKRFNVPVFYNSVRCTESQVSKALNSRKFETWKENMKTNKNIFVTHVIIDSVVFMPDNAEEVKYIKIKATCFTKESYEAWLTSQSRDNKLLKFLPGIAFLRGPKVAVMVVIPTETEEFTVLTVNRRLAVAKPSVPELPTGDIDETGDFVGEASDFLHKELEIQIKEMDLVDLTQLAFGNNYPGMFPSCGGCDEYVVLYLYRAPQKTTKELSKIKADLDTRLGKGEGRLRLVSIKELWKVTPDSSALSALAIYTRLKQPGIL